MLRYQTRLSVRGLSILFLSPSEELLGQWTSDNIAGLLTSSLFETRNLQSSLHLVIHVVTYAAENASLYRLNNSQ
jgi:hypothetical protein